MSAASWASLQEAAGPVSRETFDRLVEFERVFQKWNRRINLAAQSTLDDVWRRHILDSAQLARIKPDARRWVDLGSGGGFPGLILAFLLAERDGASIDLVESNRKKASFLQAVVGQFGLPARIIARRIDDSYPLVSAPQIVTARALASLPALLELSAPWLTNGARGLFHKGRDYRAEVEESAHRWTFDLVEHSSMTDPHGVILELSDLRPATSE
ncbi:MULTISPECIES: 16S rRNA (guanine(527)-N(7))-methyltransferase RsmG [unclassified Mesorhizobium]|uniref:16S rRNA (guanine(527)-N(7))-methyltransferase RsmG n=1 Tax=unclassified Mesorhizobium TaxID=325217 RepID=UPI000FDBCB6E|nr:MULTISPECIES: 16S rRNA (guanine(527)-N(7))-methyltransferase RsmG [unclassified Mesorhizobium]TGQ35017.1 16S rRNA (guanine(527)-N(7))-methyltransferase RsmG [Mesorhizobium sp. M00.F.Ca.ET.216.01.1.1]TIS54843.1 MAG: 16S rRNA (guanine(527)-N(7))-methyltransferase RsmG [Mesorhizobium sp.]TIS86969.1 MAG: 16S rRNA (guanine(527)-N(7))-methyltransferase RsmG [Mesorhizobium sp.]TJW09178.1 MAG: 16S rRNA (guanine(527)-N(7))-methyltransferase RsmG [Mesorhizobium sp.]TJW45438.1 MAG: 16S rRNA (guanine(5